MESLDIGRMQTLASNIIVSCTCVCAMPYVAAYLQRTQPIFIESLVVVFMGSPASYPNVFVHMSM